MSRIIVRGLRIIVSIFAADRGHHAMAVDAAAGGEFLDDRIRLRE